MGKRSVSPRRGLCLTPNSIAPQASLSTSISSFYHVYGNEKDPDGPKQLQRGERRCKFYVVSSLGRKDATAAEAARRRRTDARGSASRGTELAARPARSRHAEGFTRCRSGSTGKGYALPHAAPERLDVRIDDKGPRPVTYMVCKTQRTDLTQAPKRNRQAVAREDPEHRRVRRRLPECDIKKGSARRVAPLKRKTSHL